MQLRKFFLVVSFLVGCMPVLKAQTMTAQQYIAAYKDMAIEEMRRSGIPASIKLAQGILETQSGNGWLVLNSNNHFGIKCKNNWVGKTVSYDDDARNECFRKYDNAAASYRDHSTFLQNNPRYAFLFQFSPEDYKSWAYGLKQAGYATSRTYPQQLIRIIEDYNLQQYTEEGLGLAKAKDEEETPVADNTAYAYEETPAQPAPARATASRSTAAAPAAPAAQASYPKGVFEINGRKVLYLPAGTALLQVAEQYNIRLSNLVRYNDLPGDAPLPKDMFIFLQKKSKKGKDDYHVVAAGESMHDVAQAEGIQLKWLLRRNKMRDGQEPANGERLALDGYANRTPRLLAHASQPKKDEEEEDFSTREFTDNIREEIAKSQSAETAAAPVQTTGGGPQSALPAGMVADLRKVADVTPATPGQAAPSRPAAAAPAAPVQAAPVQTPAARGVLQYHDVQPKETLYGIAKRYNITIDQLQRWNNLEGNDIKIGQRLLVGK